MLAWHEKCHVSKYVKECNKLCKNFLLFDECLHTIKYGNEKKNREGLHWLNREGAKEDKLCC